MAATAQVSLIFLWPS